jgi:hypothetical protein
MLKRHFMCSSCGRNVEFSPQEPPCQVLSGWITVSHWKGLGSVEHYHFCSFTCLKRWADAQVPQIPKVFLESFEEDK